MTRPLALHQITAMTADPADLLRIAAQVGCASVCLFTHVPQVALPDAKEGAHAFPMVTPDNQSHFRAVMAETGVGVSNIEFFPVSARVIAPMPPRAKPQAPTLPSTSPM